MMRTLHLKLPTVYYIGHMYMYYTGIYVYLVISICTYIGHMYMYILNMCIKHF